MATPTITRLSRASGAYFQSNTGAAYDRRVLSGSGNGIHIYEVTLADGESATYEELFTAIGNHADWTVSITDSGNSVDGTDEPSRIINISAYGVSNHSGVILLKSGRYFHEIAGSTYVNFSADQMFMPLIGSVNSVDDTGSSLSEVGITYGIDTSSDGGVDVAWNATHEITLGTVRWRAGRRMFQLSQNDTNGGNNGAQRAVDWGDPRKITNASALQTSLAAVGPAAGQTLTVTNQRLIYECATGTGSNHNTQRQDFDITGEGRVNIEALWRRVGALSYHHTTNSNPASTFLINTSEDLTVSGNSQTWKYTGAPEAFSTLPANATHPYLSTTEMKSTSEFESIHYNLTGTMGKYFAAFAGNNRFQPASGGNSTTGLVIQGLKATGIQYFKFTFASANHGDIVWIDPPFQFGSTSATPTRRNEDFDFGISYLRSVGVNNRDASGAPKTSRAFTVGNQKSANTYSYQSNSASFWDARVPELRSHANGGTWSVREADTTGAGLDGVVGRAAHYLVDAVLDDASSGSASSHYTYMTDSAQSGNIGDNVSYLIHRGGIHRYSQNINLRTYTWDLNSNGSQGFLANNDVDDVPGVTDNMVALFKAGLTGNATATSTISANGTENITLDGMSNLTPDEVETMVGARVIGTSGNGVVNSATRTNATTVVLNITAGSSGFSQTNDQTVNIYWDEGYSWDIASSGDNDITITLDASTDITWNYSAVPALVQAKVELITEAKQGGMGNETLTWTSGNDSTYGGGSLAVNVILERMLQNSSSAADKSFFSRNTTTGTTLDVHRIVYSVPSGSTLTLNPDDNITAMNYGSSYAVAERVTHNGTFTDTNGTPSFIDVVLPSGVATSDVKISVAYQAGSDWRIGANPTITTSGTRTFIQVAGNTGPDATGNTDNVWYLSITGGKIVPVRRTYTGSAAESITLAVDPLRPASSPITKSGTITAVSYVIGSPGSNSETKTLTTVSGNYPRSQINTINRLGLFINAYNSQTDGARTRIDVGDALNSTEVADYVARYGTAAISSIVRTSDANLTDAHWRIRYDGVSKIDFLKMDGLLPTTVSTDANFFEVDAADNDAVIFFEAPTYSAAEVQGLVQSIVDEAEVDIISATRRIVNNAN